MSVIQAPHGVTYYPKEALEYIWLPAVAVGGLEDFFKVLTNVNRKTQVLFAQRPSKITTKSQGCTPTFNDPKITRSEKFWDPQPVEATLKQCYTDLYGSIHQNYLRPGTERPDITGTENETIILDAMIPAAAEDLVRMCWLADMDIVGSSLTGGAGDVKNYNQVNGFWKRIVAGVVANLTARYTIAENSATTTAGQQLAAGRAQAILSSVYFGQKLVMKQMPDSEKRFFVTRNIYENYLQSLIANNVLESNKVLLTDGTTSLSFMGIMLEIVDVVDTYLTSDFTFGTGANTTITNPTRVVLTVKDNFQVAVDTPSSNPIAFDSWYEKKDRMWYADAQYMLDTQIALEQLVSVAY